MSPVTFRKTSGAILAGLTLLAATARAAEVTRVVSAFDDENGFDLNLTASWLHEAKSALIKRESESAATAAGPIGVLPDFKYAQTRDVLNLRLDFGVLWDVGLHVQAPLVLADSNTVTLDSGVSGDNAAFLQSPSASGSQVFKSPTRSGFQDLGLGVTWAVFNQRRDDTKPTWTLGFDADLDVFKDMRFDPANPNGNQATGLGYHQLIWSTWVSKRFRHFDPYFGASYMLPIRTNGSIFQDYNPATQTSVNPQQQAMVTIGVEQIAWENPTGDQRVTVELQAHAAEHFAGRGTSELWEPLSGHPGCTLSGGTATETCRPSLDVSTDAMGNQHASPYTGVTDIDAYGSFGGEAGLNIQVGKYIRFRALYGMTFDAAHFITNASAGVDANHDGRVDSSDPKEANPTYRESIDIPGRRFRVEDSRDWHLFVQGSLMF